MLEYPRAVPAMHQQPDHGATPQVPSGWAVRWNDQYRTWFYVNTHTSVSQWHPPTEPVFPPGTGSAHAAPPRQDARHSLTDDEALARRLQAEEDAMGMGMDMGMSAHDQHPPAQPPRPHSGAGYDGFAPAAPQVPYGVHHSAAGASGGVDAGYAPGAYAETAPGRHSGSFSSTGGPIDPSYHQQYPHLQGQQSGGGSNRQSRLLGKVYDKVGGKLAVAGVGAGALRPSSSSGRLSPYPQDHQQHQPQRPTSAGGYYPHTHSHGGGSGGGKKSNKKKYLAALGLGGGAAAVGGGAGAAGYYGGQELSDGLSDGIDGGKESRLSKYSDKYGSKIAKKLFKDSGHGEEEGGEGGEGGGGGEEDDGGDDGGLGEALGEGAGEGSGEGVGEVISALLGG